MHSLRDRIATYIRALPRLLPQHEGKYALVCDDSVNVYDTYEQAWEALAKDCTNLRQFLVMRIEPLPAGFRH